MTTHDSQESSFLSENKYFVSSSVCLEVCLRECHDRIISKRGWFLTSATVGCPYIAAKTRGVLPKPSSVSMCCSANNRLVSIQIKARKLLLKKDLKVMLHTNISKLTCIWYKHVQNIHFATNGSIMNRHSASNMVDHSAVSYTHLTLPTIYSV